MTIAVEQYDALISSEQRVGELEEALRGVISWEKDYRQINHLGQIAPHEFKQAKAALYPNSKE